jgi:hypothetical protein
LRKSLALVLLLVGALAFTGCSKQEEEAPQPITANIDNTSPDAKNAPAAPMDESPGALAARMGGGRGLKKMGPK